jgi:protein SCO1
MNRVLLLLLFVSSAALAAELPRESVYHLDAALTDQDGRALRFAALAGEVRVVTMFYAECPYVCPMIVEALKRTERELTAEERARFRVVMLTLDPERDTPAALRRVAGERRVDTARWTLARSEPRDVRKLAALLGIQYRQLENRDFNHSSALVLLDAEGRVLARSSRIGEADPEFTAAVRAALAEASGATGDPQLPSRTARKASPRT